MESYYVVLVGIDGDNDLFLIESANPLQAREFARENYRRDRALKPSIPVDAKCLFDSSDPKEASVQLVQFEKEYEC